MNSKMRVIAKYLDALADELDAIDRQEGDSMSEFVLVPPEHLTESELEEHIDKLFEELNKFLEEKRRRQGRRQGR